MRGAPIVVGFALLHGVCETGLARIAAKYLARQPQGRGGGEGNRPSVRRPSATSRPCPSGADDESPRGVEMGRVAVGEEGVTM